MSEWGNRLLTLARGALPSETGVTHVTTRNRNPGYVSENPLVTPVTPVTPPKVPIPNEEKIEGVTSGVTLLVDPSERAALIEFGANVPRLWAEAFANLDCATPIAGFSQDQWRQVIDDGGAFLDAWGAKAPDHGWAPADVFDTPAGLVFLIRGGRVLVISDRRVFIERVDTFSIYSRHSRDGACCWEPETEEGNS